MLFKSKKTRRFAALIIAFLLINIPLVFAQQPSETVITKPVGSDVLPGGQILESDIETSAIFSRILPFVIKYAIRLAIILAVIALIIGGYQFMTAYGDSEKRQTAQKTIIWAVVGLVLAITAFGIVNIISTIQFTVPE